MLTILAGKIEMTPLHDQQRGYRFQGALALDRLIEGEARQLVPSWWPQRDLPPGGPIPAVPFEGHCLPELEGLPWPSVHGASGCALPQPTDDGGSRLPIRQTCTTPNPRMTPRQREQV